MDSAVIGARFSDGGHLVNGEDAERLPASLPEPKPAPPMRITPSTRRRVLALIPAAGGLLLFAVEAVRYFHHH